jgi:hypothetical protein
MITGSVTYAGKKEHPKHLAKGKTDNERPRSVQAVKLQSGWITDRCQGRAASAKAALTKDHKKFDVSTENLIQWTVFDSSTNGCAARRGAVDHCL